MSDFGRMLEQEIPRLRRYARALTRDPVQDDDLVQNTLVRALAKSHLWQPGTNLRHWLFVILHNQRVSEVRSLVREQRALADERIAFISSASSDPDTWASLAELDGAIAALPQPHHQVVLLIGLEEMSYREAADILGIPLGTVRSRLARARATLRKSFRTEAEIARPARAKDTERYERIAA